MYILQVHRWADHSDNEMLKIYKEWLEFLIKIKQKLNTVYFRA